MNRKRLTAMVLSGVLAASMAVTGTAAEDQVTITFSLWDEIQSVVYQQLIDNFEEQNPNIHVDMQLTPWDQYWTKFDASAGGGAITVKVSGEKTIKEIKIKPDVVDPEDVEMLEDLILTCVNEALRKVDSAQADQLGKYNIPGLGGF